MSRRHNDANVVTLSGARLGPSEADAIVRAFLRTEFEGGRHARRVGQIHGGGGGRGNGPGEAAPLFSGGGVGEPQAAEERPCPS